MHLRLAAYSFSHDFACAKLCPDDVANVDSNDILHAHSGANDRAHSRSNDRTHKAADIRAKLSPELYPDYITDVGSDNISLANVGSDERAHFATDIGAKLSPDNITFANADPDGTCFRVYFDFAQLRRSGRLLSRPRVHDRVHSYRRGTGVGKCAHHKYDIPRREIGRSRQLGVGRWKRLGRLHACEHGWSSGYLRDQARDKTGWGVA